MFTSLWAIRVFSRDNLSVINWCKTWLGCSDARCRMLWCGFLEARCIRGCSQRSYVTCGKWCLEISEMDLNHCLGALRLKRRQDCGSNKNNSSNQILIGSIGPGGQLSCYYFPGKWPNNLNRCLHRLHPASSSIISRSGCTSGSIKQISFTKNV